MGRFVKLPYNNHRRRSCTSTGAANKCQCGYILQFCTFPCNLKSTILKNGPAVVSAALCYQATGSAMNDTPELQEEREQEDVTGTHVQ